MANLLSTSINGTLKVDSAAGAKKGFEFKENGTNCILVPLTASSLDLGSQTLPFKDVYANNFKLTSNTGATNLGNTDTSTFMQVSDDSTGKTSKIILGNETKTSESAGRAGQILLYGADKGGTLLKTKQTGTATNEISFPSKDGTVSLEGHSHAFKTSEFGWFIPDSSKAYSIGQNTNGRLWSVTKPSDKYILTTDVGKLIIKNCYGWGSDFLDIFTIRGYASFTPSQTITANTRLRLGCLKTKKAGYLPKVLVPLSCYTHNKLDPRGFISVAEGLTGNYVEESYIDIRYPVELAKDKTYVLYFAASYGRIYEEPDSEEDVTE